MHDHATLFRFLPFYESLVHLLWGFPGVWIIPPGNRSWIYETEVTTVDHVFTAALVFVVLVCIALVVRGKLLDVKAALIPDPKLSLRTVVEMITEIALGLMKGLMKPQEARYFLPLIGTCALFILFSNLLGLVPMLAPPTSVLNTTVACAVVIFVTTHVYGIKTHGAKYIMHFFGPVVPTRTTPFYAIPFVLALMVLMFAIELVSHLARPLSLSMRLMGNMFADHTVVAIFTALVPLVPIVVPLPAMALGVFVCFVQTFVFCLLSIIYISLAIEHAEEH
jgi:F-type H+-transporting ATPase subunit a